MAVIVVDDWVAIEGSFSTDNDRVFCPNDGLAHFLLRHFLAEGRSATVTYGLSSVQECDQCGGLHNYKRKVGFEAQPVHRAFVLHPMIRPFASPWALRSVKAIKEMFPGNRLVKKVGGVADMLLGNRALVSIGEGR
jgi:hypothetical protein